MRPTDILSSEHRVIEQVLDCLEKMAQQCKTEGKLQEQPARDAVDFFRNYADRWHHAKEEAHLFPAMEAKGYPRDGGPTGVMFHEHELGRAHIGAIEDAIDEAAKGDAAAIERFVQNAAGYVALLRQHIEKEDHCLYGMANQAFSESEQQELMAAFRKAEAEQAANGSEESYVAIANALADRFSVARAGSTENAEVAQSRHGCAH